MIKVALSALVDPRSGCTIVRAVYRREELYHGPYVENLPDLIVVLQPEYAAMTSLADRSVVVPAAYRLRSGDHRDEGILMISGPQIIPGRLATAPTLTDLTPTILHLLEIPPSHQLDGRVLTEAFPEDWLQRHPLRAPQATEAATVLQPFEYTPEEQAAIQHRLEQLGYL
jgi:predicted AlkP superfamily phosphohydrolase/phosphomutase